MARAVAKSKPTTATKPSSNSSPKKRLGRPPGSKNKVTAGTARQLPTASVSKRTPAPAASKMSKADLEAQVVKLGQALARSRNQVAKLKQIASDLGERVERAEQAELDRLDASSQASAAGILKEKPVKQKPVATRGRRKKGTPPLISLYIPSTPESSLWPPSPAADPPEPLPAAYSLPPSLQQ